ncbi:MAG: efflux RND transporter permease subunit [Pseudomonadota bacterium]
MNLPIRNGGPIAWMARNSVAANLLMLVLILGGIAMMFQIRQEYLPSTDPDTVEIRVELDGATPAEVEQSVVLVLEDALSGIQGIEKMTARAYEGAGGISVELSTDMSRELIYNEIQQAVDQIDTFPDDADQPELSLSSRRWDVVEVQLYGPVTPQAMRAAGEHVRTYLLQQDDITQVEIANEEQMVLHVEVPEAALQTHDLTLRDIAQTIRQAALDRAGGTLETAGGDLLVRLADRKEAVSDFESIPVVTADSGTVIRLGDLAEVTRGFADGSQVVSFNSDTALRLEVFRVGDQTPISISDAVHRAIPDAMSTLPEAIEMQLLNDRSDYYKGRMNLLIKNGLIGLGLVLLLLTLFLEIRLAFWVALGIPTAFMGAMLILPWTGSTINLISMFAFILALGIVVDDAIVAGENIYEYRQRGMQRLEAAIQGARDIAVPLSFSILTNIVAFIPLALVPGWMGKMWFVIPVVVSLAFIMSWIEALFILPAHLSHGHGTKKRRLFGPIAWIGAVVSGLEWILKQVQRFFAAGLQGFIQYAYRPVLRVALSWRYATVSLMIAILAITIAWVESGRMGWGLFPPVPRDYSKAVVSMPVGSPEEVTLAARDAVVAAAQRVIDKNGGEQLSTGVSAEVSDTSVEIRAYLTPPDVRTIGTRTFTSAWRKELGEVPSVRSVRFESSWGGPGGTSIAVRLSHASTQVLEEAAADLARRLADYGPVRDVDDGFAPGKTQLEFSLTEAGRALGLTSDAVAAQVRAAFFGVEALAQQDGRNEVEVRVRKPRSERTSEYDIERLLIRTPDGGTVPLYEVADVSRSRADATISREDGQRIVNVTANVEPRSETNQVIAAVTADVLPQLQVDFPGLAYSLEGRQAAQKDTMRSFMTFSIPLALMIIYGLLAIPFRSYLQPMVIMMAIPFGFVGAVIGHEIMGYGLSIISVFGIIALSGVVINAGIVMIDYANKARATGLQAYEAIEAAGLRRFRPILLTTVTTFGGLAPMIFETSRQAKFLIPMAISLGYGIVFATVIVLLLIPALYLVLEDIRALFRWIMNPSGDPRPPEKVDDDLPIPAE